jgi:hypothetical protein
MRAIHLLWRWHELYRFSAVVPLRWMIELLAYNAAKALTGSGFVSDIRQHTSACVRIRQHTSPAGAADCTYRGGCSDGLWVRE